MAYFVKRSGGWQAQIRRKGVSESRTFPTKAQARAWAAEREDGIRAEARGEFTKTVAQALQRFSDEVSPTRRGGRWEQLRIKALAAAIPAMRVADLTPDDIAAWRDRRLADGVKASTVNRELNVLAAVLEHARREWRWLAVNPAHDVRRPKNPAHRQRLMTDGERDRILLALGHGAPVATLSQQVAVALLLALETGMRAGELMGLRWADVHARHVHLPTTKNGTARDVPLSSRAVALIELLRGLDADRVFTVSNATRDTLFRKARDRCKIEGLTFHDTRHTAVTRLARKVDVMTLARMIGHRDLKSLMVYYNESAESIAQRLD